MGDLGLTGPDYGGKDLRRIRAELLAMNDREILKRFGRELRKAAAPMVPAVRASIGGIPAKGPRSTGLRQAMQRATRISVRTAGRQAGVRVLVDPKKMPDGKKALPQYMEGAEGHARWRHPVFGRSNDPWEQQDPHPYFFRVVQPLGLASRAGVGRAVESVKRDIT